jgi:uncharacterized protein
MILYLDTSALVKLFLVEEGRELTIDAVGASSEVCTSAIAYAEVRATFARKLREGTLTVDGHTRAVGALDASWRVTTRMAVSIPLAMTAGAIAQSYGLRGYDAVHLASALDFRRRFGEMMFLGFDDRLNAAAEQAGLDLFTNGLQGAIE